MTGPAPTARLERVTRRYRDGQGGVCFALEDTTLDVAPSTLTVITGRSGSGKTTLLNLLGALDRPDTGRVWVLGRDLSSLSEAALSDLRRESMGFVYQRFHFVEHLPVWQNVTCRLLPAGVPAAERRERARVILEEMDLGAVLDRLPTQLSGGEQQRVALARAVCHSPAMLIADEPTSNVDARTGAAVIERLLENRARGTAIVVATHDPALLPLADVHLVMERGRVL